MDLIYLMKKHRFLINYIFIGISSLVIEAFFLRIFRYVNLRNSISLLTAFLIGLIFSYVFNSKLNFHVPKKKNFVTFIVFSIISTVAFSLNIVFRDIFLETLGMSYLEARLVSSAFIFGFSYTMHRKLTFRNVKLIGVAIYAKASEKLSDIWWKVRNYPDFIHIDLVDNTFDKNAQPVDLKIIKEIYKMWYLNANSVHVMSKKPLYWIKKIYRYVKIIIFHVEINDDVNKIISFCKRHRKKVGLAISPISRIDEVIPYLDKIDYVEVLGVIPGRSGQDLDPESFEKLNTLAKLKRKYNFDLIYDGGVKIENIRKINAKYIVSASTILNSKSPLRAIRELKSNGNYKKILREGTSL
jgi:ribulose-phosphate 3-epimerase